MRLVVKAWLMLRAPDRYLYRVHLESDLAFSGEAPLKTYAAEGEALGSSVRWVTASDQEPIAEATAQALHQLATQIEQDREFVIKATHR
jgi:poly-gamma-glutamate capsule biosynthesis protein CapA/YwtB (metallophosphatase superfamily)